MPQVSESIFMSFDHVSWTPASNWYSSTLFIDIYYSVGCQLTDEREKYVRLRPI